MPTSVKVITLAKSDTGLNISVNITKNKTKDPGSYWDCLIDCQLLEMLEPNIGSSPC